MMIRSVLALALMPPGAVQAFPTAVRGDVTAAVRANGDIVLGGDASVSLPSGTTTYTGVISGQGTLTVRGTGTLVLTKDATFTLPAGRRHQRLVRAGGNHWYVTVRDPDPPAVTVAKGATLQYGDTSGPSGVVGSYPYGLPGYQLNQDNIRVDGTLRVATKNRAVSLGTISGTGLVTQPRFLWGGLILGGTQPFAGVLDNGTGMDFGEVYTTLALPNLRKVVNQGSAILATPPGRDLVVRQDFYERYYGSDVNVHTWNDSTVILGGQYSYIDPSRNLAPIAHRDNTRGTNIEGANVQWGDGTTHRIFLPGTKDTVYINLHAAGARRSRLTFAYDGPVVLGAPIGGGRYHDTLAAPGAGDVVIKGTRGNDVTFAAAQHYDGSTTVQRGAVLRLGTGQPSKDGALLTGGPLRKLIVDGTVVLNNARTAITLPPVSGAGSIRQLGAAAVTVPGPLTVRALLEYGGTAGRLTVAGSLSQSGTLLATLGPAARPLKVTGTARLAGRLRVDAKSQPAAKQKTGAVTVLLQARTISGHFTGLPEGTVATAGGRGYRLTYRGGQVALVSTGKPAPAGAVSLDDTAGTAGPSPSAATPRPGGGPSTTTLAGTPASSARTVFVTASVLAAVLLTIAAALRTTAAFRAAARRRLGPGEQPATGRRSASGRRLR
jgi:hypothetical protein